MDASVVQEKRSEELPARSGLTGLRDKWILLFLFTTGMVSMGMEIVWIR